MGSGKGKARRARGSTSTAPAGALYNPDKVDEFLHDLIDSGGIVLPDGYSRDDVGVVAFDHKKETEIRIGNLRTGAVSSDGYSLSEVNRSMGEAAHELAARFAEMFDTSLHRRIPEK